MTRTSPPQVAFSSGELDPLLHRRFDYQRFQTGLAACRGFLPLAQGAATRAPGTLYRGRTRGDALAVFVPFVFAANDACVLEFTPGFMRVWRYGQLVMKAGVPYEIATPYDAASLLRLSWKQSADVVYLCDGLRPIQRLARYALDDWTIGDLPLTTGPFRVQNLDKTRTIRASAESGTVTLTGVNMGWDASWVGQLVMVQPGSQANVKLWVSNTKVWRTERRRAGKNLYELISGNGVDADSIGDNMPVHTEGDMRTDNTPTIWRYISDDIGILRITAVGGPNTATATVLRTLPASVLDEPTYRWSEGAWSARHGYPACLEIYDQRLCAACTPDDPRTVWFSAIGDFADFLPGTEADDAFAYAVAGSTTQNRVINLRAGTTGLHIFALGEEYSTRSDTRGQAIGPTTAFFGLDASIGSSPAAPIAPSGTPIFISRDRRRLYELAYSLDEDRPVARILSRTAQHIGADFFDQIVWQGAPEPMAWLRTGAGELVAMVYDKGEDVLGWAPLPIAGGFVDAMAVYPAASGGSDVVMLAVLREIDGQLVRAVEEIADPFGILTGAAEIAEAVHFYCAGVFSQPTAPVAVFSLPWLAGRTVYAWTDQGEFGPLAVSAAGVVTLPVPVGRACIGLFDETHVFETLDIQAAAPDGNSMGRAKRLQGIGVALHRTAQGYVQTVERDLTQVREGAAQSLIRLPVASVLTQAFSGVVRVDAPSGNAKEVAVRIRPRSGAPLTVTAVIPVVQEAGL